MAIPVDPWAELDKYSIDDKLISRLEKLYSRAEDTLQRRLSNPHITEFSKARINELQSQINNILDSIKPGARALSKSVINKRASAATDNAMQIAKKLLRRGPNFDSRINTAAVDVVVKQLVLDNDDIISQAKKFAARYLRLSQQSAINDSLMSEKIAEGLIVGDNRTKVSKALLSQMRERIENAQFITINGRNYQPSKYAAAVARTRTREATAQASVGVAVANGMDLVQIDVHTDACPICQQFMGRVYSISGNDGDFPKLEQIPPFHVHCECNPWPVNRESLVARGNYQKIVDLSNNPKSPTLNHKKAQEWVHADGSRPIGSFREFKAAIGAKSNREIDKLSVDTLKTRIASIKPSNKLILDADRAKSELGVVVEKFRSEVKRTGGRSPIVRGLVKDVLDAESVYRDAADKVNKQYFDVLSFPPAQRFNPVIGVGSVGTQSDRKIARKSLSRVFSFINKDVLSMIDRVEIRVINTDSRSYYKDKVAYISRRDIGDTVSLTHELGHIIENSVPEIKGRIRDFLTKRTKGSRAKKVGKYYRNDELTRDGGFIDPYIGKIYSTGDTEVLSMGLEYLVSDPMKLLKGDEEMFDLIVSIVRGIQ